MTFYFATVAVLQWRF